MADYIQVPPDSTGKKIYTGQYTIDGADIDIQRVQLACSDYPDHVAKVDNKGAIFVRTAEGSPALDTFSKTKNVTSSPVGIYEFSNDDYADLFCVLEESGGTITYNANVAAKVISTTTDAASHANTATNRFHYYQVGTGALVQIAASVSADDVANNTMRWGMYDEHEGFAFTVQNGVFGLLYRTSMSGSLVDTFIPQSAWNVDKLDGTGLSGLTLDPTQAWNYFGNYNWPIGTLRLGVYAGSDRVVCHEVNMTGSAYPITAKASLPFRFENLNTSLTTTGTSLRIFGAAILVEGDSEYTFWRYSGQGCTAKTVTTNTPLFSTKCKLILDNGNPNHIMSVPERLSVYTDQPIKVDIYWHDTSTDILTDATWLVDNGSTTICDNAATAIDTEDATAWKTMTFFCAAGVENIDLAPYFELNDEALVTHANEQESLILSFVATKLGASDATVTVDLSSRELW